jgi:hypothetical protein
MLSSDGPPPFSRPLIRVGRQFPQQSLDAWSDFARPNRCASVIKKAMVRKVDMTRQRFNFWIDDDLRHGLKTVRDRDGIVESEQIRRAVRDWLQKKGLTPKLERNRVPARKRA